MGKGPGDNTHNCCSGCLANCDITLGQTGHSQDKHCEIHYFYRAHRPVTMTDADCQDMQGPSLLTFANVSWAGDKLRPHVWLAGFPPGLLYLFPRAAGTNSRVGRGQNKSFLLCQL